MTVTETPVISRHLRNAQLTMARELLFFRSILNLPMIHSAIRRGMLSTRNRITKLARQINRNIGLSFRLYFFCTHYSGAGAAKQWGFVISVGIIGAKGIVAFRGK